MRFKKSSWLAIFAIVIAVWFTVALFWLHDAQLSPAGEQLLELSDKRPTTQEQRNAYAYLFGIGAAADQQPLEVGQRYFAQVPNSTTLDTEQGATASFPELPNTLSLPESELFCGLHKAACLTSIEKAKASEIATLLQENDLLMQRVNEFNRFKSYKTITQPAANEPIPIYQYLFKGYRLLQLEMLIQHQEQPSQALQHAINLLQHLRHFLAQQDTLIGKLVYTKVLHDQLDIISLMLRNHSEPIEPFPLLSHEEKSLAIPCAREFSGFYHLLVEIKAKSLASFHKDILSGEAENIKNLAFFKPVMTANAMVPNTQYLTDLSLLPVHDFAAKLAHETQPEKPKVAPFRNYIGNVLLDIAGPDWTLYVSKIMALDARISLFNQIYADQLSTKELSNPFDLQLAVTRQDDQICLALPDQLKSVRNCILTRKSDR